MSERVDGGREGGREEGIHDMYNIYADRSFFFFFFFFFTVVSPPPSSQVCGMLSMTSWMMTVSLLLG